MIYLGDQVTVEVETEDMEFEAARKVVGKLDLKKLAALKPKPAPAPGEIAAPITGSCRRVPCGAGSGALCRMWRAPHSSGSG
jgi:hypothetical protein